MEVTKAQLLKERDEREKIERALKEAIKGRSAGERGKGQETSIYTLLSLSNLLRRRARSMYLTILLHREAVSKARRAARTSSTVGFVREQG